MIRALTLLAGLFSPNWARACELALVLAVDVSGSVDPREFLVQRDGLAEALRDSVVSEALVAGRANAMVLQWSGAGRQAVTVPWTAINSFDDLDRFAAAVASDTRVWRHFSTAIGDALMVSLSQFKQVPHCKRRVIDVSGDGRSNEGVSVQKIRGELSASEVTVNGLVIEGAEDDLTAYFWENVIHGEGAFVVTANSFREYPERIRRKLRQETTKQTAFFSRN